MAPGGLDIAAVNLADWPGYRDDMRLKPLRPGLDADEVYCDH
jgi:hypothetical protein